MRRQCGRGQTRRRDGSDVSERRCASLERVRRSLELLLRYRTLPIIESMPDGIFGHTASVKLRTATESRPGGVFRSTPILQTPGVASGAKGKDMALLCAETQQIDCQDGNRLQPHFTAPNQETVRLPDFFSPTPFPIASLSKQLIVQIWLAFQPLWTPNSYIHSREKSWRRGRDSNPRGGFPPTRLAGERLQPLGHLSAKKADGLRNQTSSFRESPPNVITLEYFQGTSQGAMAEGEGFEPPRDLSAPNGFQDRRLQPLGHPSAGRPRGGHALTLGWVENLIQI